MSTLRPHIAFLMLLAASARTYGDSIVLTNHDHLTGTIEQVTTTEIIITTPYAQHLVIPREQIQSFNTDQAITPRQVASTNPATAPATTAPGNRIAGAAPAAPPLTPPQPVSLFGPHWKNQFSFGFVNSTGNTDQTQLASGIDLHYLDKPNDLSMKAAALYATVNGEVNQSLFTGDFIYRRDLPDLTPRQRWYFFTENHELYDGIKGISLRSIDALGPGYYIWKGQKLTADLRSGPGFTYEHYFNGVTNTDATLLVGLRALYQFSPRISLSQDTLASTAVTDWSRFQFAWETDLNVKLPEVQRGAGLKLAFIDDYDSTAGQNGRKDNDTRIIVSLTLDF